MTRRYAAAGEPMRFLLSSLETETDDCVVWPYSKTDAGHGQIAINGRPQRVHVVACELAYGPRPPGAYAIHGPCHNPACFNPKHLTWDTPKQNMEDKVRDRTLVEGEECNLAKLTQAQVDEIRATYARGGVSLRELGNRYGISKHHTWRIVNWLTWIGRARERNSPDR